MAVGFDCPHCKAHYEVADDLGGKTIMCRVCQKRGQVRKLAGTTATPATGASAGVALASSPQSRRKFLLIGGGALASVLSIATGAILARWRPWQRWGQPSPEELSTRRRGPGGPGGPGRGKKGDPGDKADKGPTT